MKFHPYADDTQLYTPSVVMILLILPLQLPRLKAVLSISLTGLTTNKLELNNDKTELLILHS